MIDLVRRSAEEAGRDPTTVEVTVQGNATDREGALTEVEALQGLGATRILIPAVLFGSDLESALTRYGEEVIDRV